MDVKKLITTQRIRKGLTMKQLAKLCDVSEGTVSRWESGFIATMKQNKIAKLCKALDISPAVFCDMDNDTYNTTELNIISDFRSLSADGQRDVLRYIRMLKLDEQDVAKKSEQNLA